VYVESTLWACQTGPWRGVYIAGLVVEALWLILHSLMQGRHTGVNLALRADWTVSVGVAYHAD